MPHYFNVSVSKNLSVSHPGSRAFRSLQISLTRLIISGVCCLFLAINNPVLAQTEGSDEQETIQWYQVEIYIFANEADYAGSTEHWPDNVELQYPSRMVELQDTGFSPAETIAPGGYYGDLSLSANAPPASQNSRYSFSNEQQLVLDGQEPPFVKLDPSEHMLSNAASRLGRRDNYRTLFHQAWRQPVLNREESTSILIRGGDRFDDHYELEGSINLSVERYLHIKTDLWLSTFKSAAGLDFSWPKLPPLPFGDHSQKPTTESLQQASNQDTGIDNAFDWNYGQSSLSLLAMKNRLYQVDRTVVLRQSRRMRSEELHYLDHPLLGMLIKVVPYDAPIDETEQSQETETATEPGTVENESPITNAGEQ